ncbi:TetR/AcrR family transcriptional regulator [soil metagenome]
MARTKEFDPEKALQAAVLTFWRLGYEHTSLSDLMQAMGIARQSLYDTFGDKRSLYLQALSRYRDDSHASLRALFAEGRSVKEGFSALLYGMSRKSRAEHERGCLLLSANMERASDDAEIATFLRGNQKTVEAIFTEALQNAMLRGEVDGAKDAAGLARFFVATIQGMRAMARLNHDRKALASVAAVALQSLN